VLATAVVAAADAAEAEEVLEAAFFLGMGEDATRARSERERMVDEKRMFAARLVSEKGGREIQA
jgi:hypothetical protein